MTALRLNSSLTKYSALLTLCALVPLLNWDDTSHKIFPVENALYPPPNQLIETLETPRLFNNSQNLQIFPPQSAQEVSRDTDSLWIKLGNLNSGLLPFPASTDNFLASRSNSPSTNLLNSKGTSSCS